jgi:hypothetical protein
MIASTKAESKCTNKALDVVFVVDHSRSMSGNIAWKGGDTCGGACKCAATNSCWASAEKICAERCAEYYWHKTQSSMRGFVKSVVKEFRDLEDESDSDETTRFGWVGFNNIPNGPVEEFSLVDGAGSYGQIAELIDNSFTSYQPDTCMQEGLEHVYDAWAPGKAGNRVENADVVIMVTDGAYHCGNKGNCVINGALLDKRDPACAVDAASRLRDRGTTIFSVDILQWTCPQATTYAECVGVSDEGRAELMADLAGEKGCVPAEAPESKWATARSLTRSGAVKECKHYAPVLQFSGLADKVKEIMDEVCEVIPEIGGNEETGMPTSAPTGAPTEAPTAEPIELPCNPLERCSGKFVCTGLNWKGKNRCVTNRRECSSRGWGEALYDKKFCETEEPMTESPTVPTTDSPTDSPTVPTTDSPTVPPTVPTTDSPTVPPTDASVSLCSEDGRLEYDTQGFALITEGDASVSAHTLAGGVSIGGEMKDSTPQANCAINDHSYFGEGVTGNWNFNGGKTVGTTPWENNWKYWEGIANEAKDSNSNGKRVIVVTEGGLYHQGSFGFPCPTAENTLVIYKTTEKVTLGKGTCGGDFKFKASVLAPFAEVELMNDAHFADGTIIAKSYKGGQGQTALQLHGKEFTGDVFC